MLEVVHGWVGGWAGEFLLRPVAHSNRLVLFYLMGGWMGGWVGRLPPLKTQAASGGVEIHPAHLALGHDIDALPIRGDGVGDLVVGGTGEVTQGEGVHKDETLLACVGGGWVRE